MMRAGATQAVGAGICSPAAASALSFHHSRSLLSKSSGNHDTFPATLSQG